MSSNSFPRNRSRGLQRALGIAAAASLALGFALVASPASAAPGDEHLAGLEYVALGDSYASGFGLGSYSAGAPHLDCDQSSLNYPHLVATELGLDLFDASCSAATMENITTTQQVVSGTPVPLQDSYLSASTDVVTLTIAGNDLGFVPVMTACAALLADGPVLGDPTDPLTEDNCKAIFAPGGVDTLSAAITSAIGPALAATLADIAAKAPNAKIFLVGYPALTPDAASVPAGPDGCFRKAVNIALPPTYDENAYPYTPIDVPYLHGVETTLDTTFASVAVSAGAVYVPMLAGTSAHSPCADLADQFVNGLTITTLDIPSQLVELEPGALHPNTAGVAFMTAQVEDAIRAAFPAPDEPDSQPAGDVLAATGTDSAGWLIVIGVVLLLVGGLVFGLRFAARRRTRD